MCRNNFKVDTFFKNVIYFMRFDHTLSFYKPTVLYSFSFVTTKN